MTAARLLPDQPLLRYLLLAAFLHGLALFWLRLPAGHAPAELPRLEMRLAPLPAAESPAQSADDAQPGLVRPSISGPGARPLDRDTGTSTADTVSRPDPPPPSVTDLAAAARAFVQADSRRRSGDPMYQASPLARSAPSALERAASRPVSGEKVLREGVVRITNPDGSSYCLQRPPEIANRDGPVAVVSIPMACPVAF